MNKFSALLFSGILMFSSSGLFASSIEKEEIINTQDLYKKSIFMNSTFFILFELKSNCNKNISGKRTNNLLPATEKINNGSSFYFLGKRYKSLKQLDREIERECTRLRQMGYFKFLERWYPPLNDEARQHNKSL